MSEIIISPSPTRRAFLRQSFAGAAGAMIAAGTGQGALPGAADPLIALGAERVRIEAKLNAPGQSDDVSKEQLDELSEVENQIAALVPVSPAGAIVLVEFLAYRMQGFEWCKFDDQISENPDRRASADREASMTPDEAQLLQNFGNLPDSERDIITRFVADLMISAERERQAVLPKNVVRFPVGRIVNDRFYRDKSNPERMELEAALDSIRHARDALRRQEQSVMARFHHFIGREAATREAGPAVDDPG
jgi:hypothetical protein